MTCGVGVRIKKPLRVPRSGIEGIETLNAGLPRALSTGKNQKAPTRATKWYTTALCYVARVEGIETTTVILRVRRCHSVRIKKPLRVPRSGIEGIETP
jgi:hypothetical protein